MRFPWPPRSASDLLALSLALLALALAFLQPACRFVYGLLVGLALGGLVVAVAAGLVWLGYWALQAHPTDTTGTEES